MDVAGAKDSIVVQNIQIGTKVEEIRRVFTQFGNIRKLKTINNKNNYFSAFIKYNNEESASNAVRKGTIKLNHSNLKIREYHNKGKEEDMTLKITIQNSPKPEVVKQKDLAIQKCNCLICNEMTQKELLENQNAILQQVQQIHEAKTLGKITDKGYLKLVKAAKLDLKYISRKMLESFE